jgi:hypothetical protein
MMTKQVLAVLRCAADQGIAANFGEPEQKRAVRALIRKGTAKLVRVEGVFVYASLVAVSS